MQGSCFLPIRAKLIQFIKMVFLPECFDYIGRNTGEQIDQAMEENSNYIGQFRELAKKHQLWLALGGFHHKVSCFLPPIFKPKKRVNSGEVIGIFFYRNQ
jgi:hypothetical protein